MAAVDTVDHTVSDVASPLSIDTEPRGFVAVNHASSNGNMSLRPEENRSPY